MTQRKTQAKGALWAGLALLIAALAVLPMLSVLWLATTPTENIWPIR